MKKPKDVTIKVSPEVYKILTEAKKRKKIPIRYLVESAVKAFI